MSIISPVSFLGLTSVKASILSTSSTVWLTKAVDISVSYPVHVVVYTVPTCPAPSRCVGLSRYNLSLYYTLALLVQYQLYVSCWDAGV